MAFSFPTIFGRYLPTLCGSLRPTRTEFKAYLEAINEVDTVIAVYDPDDPRCEREVAAVAVAEMLNRQVLTVDPKAIRLF